MIRIGFYIIMEEPGEVKIWKEEERSREKPQTNSPEALALVEKGQFAGKPRNLELPEWDHEEKRVGKRMEN